MRFVAAAALIVIGQPAVAQETVAYSYDALGRLVASSVSGGPSSGTSTTISHDPANNRTAYQVSGAANSSSNVGRVIVVPISGFALIYYRNPWQTN